VQRGIRRRRAELIKADLSGAWLRRVSYRAAGLIDADLSGVLVPGARRPRSGADRRIPGPAGPADAGRRDRRRGRAGAVNGLAAPEDEIGVVVLIDVDKPRHIGGPRALAQSVDLDPCGFASNFAEMVDRPDIDGHVQMRSGESVRPWLSSISHGAKYLILIAVPNTDQPRSPARLIVGLAEDREPVTMRRPA
jgi:hypothetical protein